MLRNWGPHWSMQMEENLIVRSFIDSFAPKATWTLFEEDSASVGLLRVRPERREGFSPSFQGACRVRLPRVNATTTEGADIPFLFLGDHTFPSWDCKALLSARCIGLAKSEMHKKRVTVQSAVLSTDMVWRLERYVVQQSPSLESFIGGHMLFCLYACSRWDDAQHLEAVERTTEASVELVETSARHHKTAMAAKDKSMLLPLICLGQCLHRLRSKDRMELPKVPYAMPTFDERRGCFGRAKMSSSEATLWLRDLLVRSGTHSASVEKITSHGLKATVGS